MEAMSENADVGVPPMGNGLAIACITAFAGHHPLILKPDDIWAAISCGFAKHVAKHAEALRDRFVAHHGKKELHLDADHLQMGQTPAHVWEQTVFPAFAEQIRQHVGDATAHAVAASFSTSTATDMAASQITLMAAVKEYFAFSMSTRCGVPWVQLLGSRDDWRALRERAEALGPLMLAPFAKWWLAALLPVLDEFVAAYEGRVDHMFWQHMVKKRQHGRGSGSYECISGWLPILFPYLRENGHRPQERRTPCAGEDAAAALEGCSPWVKPWRTLTDPRAGPRPEQLPSLLSSAPLRWDYLGTAYEVHLHAGSVGVRYDEASGALAPAACWYITHDLAVSPEAKLVQLRKLEADLNEAHNPDAPGYEPPYQLKQLQQQIRELETARASAGMAA